MADAHVHEQLGAWLDGELSPAKSAQVARHLEGCGECQAERQQLLALRRLLRGAVADAVAEAPLQGVTQTVMAAVRAHADERAPLMDRFRVWATQALGAFGPQLVTGVAAAAITLAVATPVMYALMRGEQGGSGASSGGPPLLNVMQVGNDASVRRISYSGASAVVYKTNEGGMTVIWVTEQSPPGGGAQPQPLGVPGLPGPAEGEGASDAPPGRHPADGGSDAKKDEGEPI